MHRGFAGWRMGLLTPEGLDAPTPPGVLAVSRLGHVLPLLAGAHPGLNRLLSGFVTQHGSVG